MDERLPELPVDPSGIVEWVGEHLEGLFDGPLEASSAFRGGQTQADRALEAFDVTGYASRRNEVWPSERRGASRLSPYIRHGLLSLPRVWSHVGGGPRRDVDKFRSELRWQEYARHWYATHGATTRRGVRYRQTPRDHETPWPDDMLCVRTNLDELHDDGWVVNQARMWLASQWAVRNDAAWQDGEEWFFRHLLDGSRAANRLGWQWTAGLSKQKVYGFSRRQVLNRAPGLCDRCELQAACPITSWPDSPDRRPAPARSGPDDPTTVAGPATVERQERPGHVWLTAESLGDEDPAAAANPSLPALFVFDEPLLRSLRLSAKRLVFLAECLADLAERREIEVWRGRPATIVADHAVAVTFAPVPGFRRISAVTPLAEVHPWPWLERPDGRSVQSFSSWSRGG